MHGWQHWASIGIAVGVIGALVPVVFGHNVAVVEVESPLRRLEQREDIVAQPDLRGLDLLRLEIGPEQVTSPLGNGMTAELTLRPSLQRTTSALLKRYAVPEAGVVLLDVDTSNVLVYANHVAEGETFDVNVRAEAPAASIFKLVTAAALLTIPGITPQTEQCYRGGQSRILAQELLDDPARDRWCASLAMAMGRSINVVFARLARKHLTPLALRQQAHDFGLGEAIPFDVATEAPAVDLPSDPLEFARAAAGFWHTHLSPLSAASMVQAIANGGVAYRPRIVRAVSDGAAVEWNAPPEPVVLRRAVRRAVASELGTMMLQTVASGSAFKAFHAPDGSAYLPFIKVASKTGTLSRHAENRHYSWFVGFAPLDKPKVAIAALVVNTPEWRIKAPQLGREVLRAYFAEENYPGVRAP
jgi:peptidoglycan glycosyltransferase